jgi:hypothetical protein
VSVGSAPEPKYIRTARAELLRGLRDKNLGVAKHLSNGLNSMPKSCCYRAIDQYVVYHSCWRCCCCRVSQACAA